jgi:hypothetical protein
MAADPDALAGRKRWLLAGGIMLLIMLAIPFIARFT